MSVFGVILVRILAILRISPYSVQMREDADQNNSECGHFLRSDGPHQFDASKLILKNLIRLQFASSLQNFRNIRNGNCTLFIVIVFQTNFQVKKLQCFQNQVSLKLRHINLACLCCPAASKILKSNVFLGKTLRKNISLVSDVTFTPIRCLYFLGRYIAITAFDIIVIKPFYCCIMITIKQ